MCFLWPRRAPCPPWLRLPAGPSASNREGEQPLPHPPLLLLHAVLALWRGLSEEQPVPLGLVGAQNELPAACELGSGLSHRLW